MYKKLIAVVTATLTVASLCAGEKIIAEWDFTKGSINSVDGRFTAVPRGKTNIGGNEKNGVYLAVGKSNKDTQEGIAMTQKYPELTPADGFRLEATFRLHEQTSTQPYLFLWDSKSITYSESAENDIWHHGFTVFIIRGKDGSFMPMAWVGHGKYSSYYVGVPVKLEEDKPHTLTFEYDGASNGMFFVNGNENIDKKRKAAKAGPISPAIYPVVIGDRTSTGPFFRFDGDIFKIKLSQINSAGE